jgi:PST family polysaccharide transporter
MLRRDMNFRVLAIRRNVAALIGGGIGVGAALAGAGVWALVAQQLSTALADVVTLWLASSWRPRFRFSFRHARDLLGYSTGVLLSSLAVFVTDRSDALMTGIFFGPVAVGLYRFGGRMVEQVLTFTSRPLPAAALPELARHQDEREHFAERVDLIARLATLASVPLLGVLAGVAGPFTDMLGSDWSDAAPSLQLLCVVGAIRSLVMLNGPVLHALGRAHLTAAIAWVTAAVSAGAFVLVGFLLDGRAVQTEVVGMALSRVAVFGLLVPVFTLPLLARFAGLAPARVLATVFPGWASGAAAWAAGSLVDALLPAGLAVVARLGISGAAAVTSAGFVLWCTDRQAREFVAKVAARVISRGRTEVSQPAPANVVEVPRATRA